MVGTLHAAHYALSNAGIGIAHREVHIIYDCAIDLIVRVNGIVFEALPSFLAICTSEKNACIARIDMY